MTANVRLLSAQRDREQRQKDNRLFAEAERIREDLTSASKKNNAKK